MFTEYYGIFWENRSSNRFFELEVLKIEVKEQKALN